MSGLSPSPLAGGGRGGGGEIFATPGRLLPPPPQPPPAGGGGTHQRQRGIGVRHFLRGPPAPRSPDTRGSNAMGSIRTLIVDDEPLGRERLRTLLENDPDIELVGECGDGAEAVATLRETECDLVFLDVQMPELDGIEVVDQIGPERMPAVIFVTAYDRYALRAFEVHALDYLLKPFDRERFERALERAKLHIQRAKTSEAQQQLLALLEEVK